MTVVHGQPPYSITPQIKNPIWHLFFAGPGSGIAMQNGEISLQLNTGTSKSSLFNFIYSDDHGATWNGKISGPKSNTTETQ